MRSLFPGEYWECSAAGWTILSEQSLRRDVENGNRVYLWIDGKKAGPFSFYHLGRMARDGEIDRKTLFWSVTKCSWLLLGEILSSSYPSNERVAEMSDARIEFVEFLGSGTGTDCPTCTALNGRRYPIGQAPKLPPEGCTYEPWCRSVLIAVESL
jgi:hypothetical protein